MPKVKKKKTMKAKPKKAKKAVKHKLVKTKSKAKKVVHAKKASKAKNVKNPITAVVRKHKDKVVIIPETVEEVEIIEVDTVKKPDAYNDHACGFVNEAECEEELDDDGLDLEDVEKDHFDEEEEQ
jgi:hypothetical protein